MTLAAKAAANPAWEPVYKAASRPTALERELARFEAASIRVPLGGDGWERTSGNTFEANTAADWAIIERQSAVYHHDRQAKEVLAFLAASKDEPSYGWQTNNYGHSLQSATLALKDGADEDMVVVALLHDIGQNIAPVTHGEFAAAMLKQFLSDDLLWLLQYHTVFQRYHRFNHPTSDRMGREKLRGHPAFELTAYFCEKYDQNAMEPDYPTLPLEAFAPLVHRFFAKTPRFVGRR
jgi:predicted HD phosphohydrolase